MNITSKIIRIICVVIILLSLEISIAVAEEFHILSEGVQTFAVKNEIFQKLSRTHREITGPNLIIFYLNMLSFADLISFKRADLLKKEASDFQDFDLAFSLVCLLPFGPIHEKRMEEIIKLRPKLVETAFTSQAKRDKIVESINTQLIVLNKSSLINREKGLFDILNIQQIISR